MKVLITGASGFIGSRLLDKLISSGHDDIRILTRNKKKFLDNYPIPLEVYEWEPENNFIEKNALIDVDFVIHLAGEELVNGRWTPRKKKKILESRVNGSKLLIEAIKNSPTTPKKFLSASAIGIYGDRGDEALDSNSSLGKDFLATVCKKWESVSSGHKIRGMKTISIRIGLVLGDNGGILKKIIPVFKAGFGASLSSGKQYMSWIHIDDLVGQFIFLLENPTHHSIYNGTAPKPVSNFVFTKILGKKLSVPTLLFVPKFLLNIFFGEKSRLFLNGQKAIPYNFINEGYRFKYETLEEALKDVLKNSIFGRSVFYKLQFINKSPKDVFCFFSNEENLELITPHAFKLKIVGKSTSSLQEGTIISYNLKLHGLPIKWKSKIINFVPNMSFVDEQIKGPYSSWEHTYDFIPYKEGTIVRDIVAYKLPFGKLGLLVIGHLVKKDLIKIFNFRKNMIGEIFS